ncbi:MAG: DUF5985 family protein [Acidobacteriota bacterium]
MSLIPVDLLTPIQHPALDLFLLGFVTACSFMAGLFFLRFWRDTHDLLFLGFAAFFLIEGASEALALCLAQPNEGAPWLFLMRLLATLAVLAAILWKNTSSR